MIKEIPHSEVQERRGELVNWLIKIVTQSEVSVAGRESIGWSKFLAV
jgi:hypothetical protein